MSYDARWALQYFYPHPDLKFRDFFVQYYKELERQHITVDIVNPGSDLTKYKAVIVPLIYLMDRKMAENIVKYVEQGGTLVYTARSGAKDENSSMVPTTLTPEIAGMLGIEIEESFALPPEAESAVEMDNGARYSISKWVNTARVLAEYCDGWYRQKTAITCNDFGKGKAYYIGTIPEGRFISEVITGIVKNAGVTPLLEAPAEIQACRRTDGKKDIVFVMNASEQRRLLNLGCEYSDVLNGKEVKGELELEPYGVYILKKR